ncbi:hypothetical protein BC829DRAFT_236475 [Chytridium lagenaria]|nr:hypothetical protein BC829DRAFT_236475 [Chytridium lagenaria]
MFELMKGRGPTILVLGSEGEGMREVVSRRCQKHIFIEDMGWEIGGGCRENQEFCEEEQAKEVRTVKLNENDDGSSNDAIGGEVESLNVSVAAAIIIHSMSSLCNAWRFY